MTLVEEYIPIGQMQTDQTYEQVFMVHSFKQQSGKRGPFVRLTLQDVTGMIEGVIWNADLNQYPGLIVEGNFVLMDVATKLYRGNMEFTCPLERVRQYNGTPDNMTDYVAGLGESMMDAYCNELVEVIEQIEDPHYRDLTNSAVNSLELINTLRNSPYGTSGPLAYRGGLLVHVVHTLRVALMAAKSMRELETKISESLIIAATVFRSIGWNTTTLFKGNALHPRDAYYMTGLYRASARYVDHLCLHTEGAMQMDLPEAKKQALHNACNPKSDIKTLEGQIVADSANISDTIHFGSHCLRSRSDHPHWSPKADGGFFVGHHDA